MGSGLFQRTAGRGVPRAIDRLRLLTLFDDNQVGDAAERRENGTNYQTNPADKVDHPFGIKDDADYRQNSRRLSPGQRQRHSRAAGYRASIRNA